MLSRAWSVPLPPPPRSRRGSTASPSAPNARSASPSPAGHWASSELSDAAHRNLFNHLIGPRNHRFRDRKAERFGGLQINHKAEPARLLEWQVGGLGAFQDTIDERCGSLSDLAAVGPYDIKPPARTQGSIS